MEGCPPSTSRDPLEKYGPTNLELGEGGEYLGWGHYMRTKIAKLHHQVHAEAPKKSDFFKGLSIYVNGYTDPPALELRQMFVENGGEYHHYYEYEKTSYTIATAMASSKWKTLRKHELIVKPSWITDSIAQLRVLPVQNYFLTPTESSDGPSRQMPGGVNEFYERSRLHLISTLAQDLKNFVAEMRANFFQHKFSSRPKLVNLDEGDNYIPADEAAICHIDMDCFFVSVALRSKPELKGKPIAITHSKSADSKGFAEIASCSYEARRKGVKAGMWMSEAVKKCPNLVCLPYEFEEYKQTSRQLYLNIANYTLDIKAVSCDEMFVDLTGLCQQLRISDPMTVVKVIRDEIEEETKCTASAGIGPNTLVARLATKKAKPNGQFHVHQSDVEEFLDKVKISDLPGVGYAGIQKINLNFDNLKTCKDLRKAPMKELQAVFGKKHGKKLFDACRGQADPFQPSDYSQRKSVSCDINFGIRLQTGEDLKAFLEDICSQLSLKLKNSFIRCKMIALKLLIRAPNAPIEPAKYGAHGECDATRKACNLPYYTDDKHLLYKAACRLSKLLKPVISDIRGIGIQATKLDTERRKRAKSPLSARNGVGLSQLPLSKFLVDKRKVRDFEKDEVITLDDSPDWEAEAEKRQRAKYRAFVKAKKKKLEKKERRRQRKHLKMGHWYPRSKECTCGQTHDDELELDVAEKPTEELISKIKCRLRREVFSHNYYDVIETLKDIEETVGKTPNASRQWRIVIDELKADVNKAGIRSDNLVILPDDYPGSDEEMNISQSSYE